METNTARICPFCEEEGVDVEHLSQCSLRDAQIVCAGNGQDFSKIASLSSKLCRIKTLCDMFEAAPVEQKERMWCCQECYAFGESDSLPVCCPDCKSFATSPANIFLEEDRSS